MEDKHALGVIVGPRAYRNTQEIELFKGLSHFTATFIGSALRESSNLEGQTYSYTETRNLFPDALAGFLVRKPRSPTSFIQLENLEKYLEKVDVINTVELYSFISKQCAKISAKKKKKFSVNVYETLFEMPYYHIPPFSCNARSVLRQADIFLAITSRAAECLRQLSVSDEKIKIIYPGVDTKMFSPSDNFDHSSFRILYVGRFDSEKGLAILLRAFLRLCLSGQDAELWIVGKPRTGERIGVYAKALAKKYPIKMLGYVDRKRLPDIYRSCDVFCLPSFDRNKWGIKVWEEQFGFVLVEAMACGLPIVATDCGAIPEVIGEDNILVPQKSINVLYETLLNLLEDEKRRRYIGKINRARTVQLFDIKKQRAKMDKALFDLLQA